MTQLKLSVSIMSKKNNEYRRLQQFEKHYYLMEHKNDNLNFHVREMETRYSELKTLYEQEVARRKRYYERLESLSARMNGRLSDVASEKPASAVHQINREVKSASD